MSAPDRLARAELLRRYGTAEALPEARLLHAGPLSARFEDGALRALRWQGVELVRGISYLLRDDNWGTVPAQLTGLRLQQDNDRFELLFDLCMPHAGHTLMARARILGTVAHQGATMQSHLVFDVEATASGPLRTNRCGFVVLHPAGCAGLPLSVTHTTGVVEDTNFPAVISPGQPVFDIRSLRHSPAPGVVVDCTLQAELPHDPSGKFEMEDQRNWSDASFKTYVASLRDPWPYELPAGVAMRQRIEVQVQVQAEAATADLAPGAADTAVPPTATLALVPGVAPGLRVPALGIGVPRQAQQMDPQERQAVVSLRPGWLVVEAELDEGPDVPASLREHLQAAAGLALDAGASVQLDLIVADACRPEAAAARAARLCREAGLQPRAVRAQARAYLKSYQPDDAWPELPPLTAYTQALRLAFPEARVGGGFVTYFTELNRKRPQAAGLDFIGHATCPIVHAADDASVMETLETLPHMARSVQALWPQLGYRLGPSTLAALRNPYGTHPTPNPQGLRLAMAERDPRHQAAFGAAWTAAYAANAVPGGLELLALHHSHGPSGPRLLPDHPDAQAAGACVPAWGVLAVLAQAAGRPVLALQPGLPSALRALAWQHDAGTAAVLIAHTGDTALRLACPAGTRWLGLQAPRAAGADLRPPHTITEISLTLQPCDTLLLHLPI